MALRLRSNSPVTNRSSLILRRARDITLTAETLLGGVGLVAPSGAGKSRFYGRKLCYDFARWSVPTVVFDSVGGTIQNAIDKIGRRLLGAPEPVQHVMMSRLKYINMAGVPTGPAIEETVVAAWPLLTKTTIRKNLYQIAAGNVDTLAKSDPALSTAPIQGLNRLAMLLTASAIVLSALNEPLTQLSDLLVGAGEWRARLTTLERTNREARAACRFLLRFLDLPERIRIERAEVLQNKYQALEFDPITRAMFSAKTPTIDWEEVVAKSQQVYIDLSGEYYSEQAKQFKLFVVWNSLLDYVKSRGAKGCAYKPLAILIDEMQNFVSGTQNTQEIIADFQELVFARKRNANSYVCCATQSVQELPTALQSVFLDGLHSHMIGRVQDYNTAESYAKRWCWSEIDIYRIKHARTVWGNDRFKGRATYYPIAYEPEFMPLNEQWFLQAKRFLELKKYEFLAAISHREGEVPNRLQKLSIKNLDPGEFVSVPFVEALQERLMLRDGIQVANDLRELEEHDEQGINPPQHQKLNGALLSGSLLDNGRGGHSGNGQRSGVQDTALDLSGNGQESTPESPPQESMGRDRGLSG